MNPRPECKLCPNNKPVIGDPNKFFVSSDNDNYRGTCNVFYEIQAKNLENGRGGYSRNMCNILQKEFLRHCQCVPEGTEVTQCLKQLDFENQCDTTQSDNPCCIGSCKYLDEYKTSLCTLLSGDPVPLPTHAPTPIPTPSPIDSEPTRPFLDPTPRPIRPIQVPPPTLSPQEQTAAPITIAPVKGGPIPLPTPRPNTPSQTLPLSNCNDDCMTLPLFITFHQDCDTNCAVEVMRRAGFNNKTKDYDHLITTNIMILQEVTDEQLAILRKENGTISVIECDNCVSTDITDDEPVCSRDNVTYSNEQEFNCNLKCHNSDKSDTIAYPGSCVAPADGSFCFSSVDQVELSNGEIKKIEQLRLGDKVLTQNGNYEAIYSWGHRNTEKVARFVKLLPSDIELSSNHLIFSQNGKFPVPAGTVEVGDILSSGETVTSVQSVTRRGLYAPFTKSGTIVVNGQVASTFVSLQQNSSTLLLSNGWSTGISHQWLARTFEFPHRLWYSIRVDCTTKGGESYTSDGISTWVAIPLQFFRWTLQLPTILQLIILIPVLFIFIMFVLIESAMTNPFFTMGLLLLLSRGTIICLPRNNLKTA